MVEIIAYGFWGLGIFFAVACNVGILRFPDIYTRLQAASLGTVTSTVCFLIGLILMSPGVETTLRLLLIGVFSLLTGPVASHAIARSAYRSGVKPWRRPG